MEVQPSKSGSRDMPQPKLKLMDLPLAVLEHVLGYLAAEEKPLSFASALLACRRLRQAGDEVPLTNHVLRADLAEAKEAGVADQLLAFLARKAKVWRQAVLALTQPEEDLCPLLRSLAPPAGYSGLQELELRFVDSAACTHAAAVWIPKDLSAMTTLKTLSVSQYPELDTEPAVGLGHLSLMPGLQNLGISAVVSGQFPPAALSSLQRLTSLTLDLQPVMLPEGHEPSPRLSAEHFVGCTALRKLRLLGVDVGLSQQQALAAWQHLEEFSLFSANNPWQPAGFWQALPQLPALVNVQIGDATEEPIQLLHNQLPGWTRLEALALHYYAEPTLPQLPTCLTELRLWEAAVVAAPVAHSLRSLQFGDCLALIVWPESMTSMSQLTSLAISYCHLGVLPAPVAALPALVKLEVVKSRLAVLPQQMACLGSLRRLALEGNELESVPAALAGGAARWLEHLDLSDNRGLRITGEGLQMLSSLTTLTFLGMRWTGSLNAGYRQRVMLKDSLSPVLLNCNIRIA